MGCYECGLKRREQSTGEGGMEGEWKEKEKMVHVLVVPFPAQSHVNPLLHLSLKLALHGVKVSFILPHSFKLNMEKAREEAGIPPPHQLGLGIDLHFLEILDVMPTDLCFVPTASFQMEDTKPVFEKMASNRGFIEETILQSRTGPNPICFVNSDNFLNWTQDMANKLGIKRIWASTNNATTLAMGLHATKDRLYIEGGSRREEEFLPSLDPIIKKRLLSANVFLPEAKDSTDMLYFGIEESYCVVVNSFEGLESYIGDGDFSMGINAVRFLGPMLPQSFFDTDMTRIEASVTGACAHKEEADCIEWLNTCHPSSVLYISFGSFCGVSPDQLREIASGIEMSRQNFLWVLRSPLDQYLPSGFLERSHGLSHVVSWAPQLRVLRHKSIGGYLTHCGWNSTIESICAGVPMLCLPLFAEQPINAILVTEHWKVGMALEKAKVGEDERGAVMMVTRDEVEKKVKALMRGGEEDNDIVAIRDCARELKEVARKAIFGSSNDRICKLIAHLQEAAFDAQS